MFNHFRACALFSFFDIDTPIWIPLRVSDTDYNFHGVNRSAKLQLGPISESALCTKQTRKPTSSSQIQINTDLLIQEKLENIRGRGTLIKDQQQRVLLQKHHILEIKQCILMLKFNPSMLKCNTAMLKCNTAMLK